MEGIGGFLTGAANLIIAAIAIYNLYTARQRAEAIATLEKNTNSIKDALIKVTGEAEHAKGVMAGKAEATSAELADRN
jgi:hypothetical protein